MPLKPRPANIRKPSIIASEVIAEQAQIDAKSAPHLAKIEQLKQEKAQQVDYFGSVIDAVRQKMLPAKAVEFEQWRQVIYALPEDDRGGAIEAKASELGV